MHGCRDENAESSAINSVSHPVILPSEKIGMGLIAKQSQDIKRNPEELKDPQRLKGRHIRDIGRMKRRLRHALNLHILVCCVIFTLHLSSRRLDYTGSPWQANLFLDARRETGGIRIVSWNLRVPFPEDASINRTWPERRQAIANAISILQPDVILLQEDFYLMNDELLHQMPVPALNGSTTFLSSTYRRYGLFNRNGETQPSKTWPENAFTGDGVRDGEHNSIWWSSQQWELVNASTFWLSPKPDVAGTSFGEVTGRIVNCVILKGTVKEPQTIRPAYHKFCSTHMPSENITRQMLSAEVISSHFAADEGKYSCSFIGGDFNTNPGSSVYKAMLDYGFSDIAAPSMPGYKEVVSTADWYKDSKMNQIIDYLWVYIGDSPSSRTFQSKNSAFVTIPCCDLNVAELKDLIEKQIRGKRLSSIQEERSASDHLALVVDIFL